jgi:hypothetical protein
MIKIVNVIWLLLIGIVLFYWLKNKKAFWIFAFSPLVWFVSIQITPILPASFFLLLAYIFMKKEKLKYRLLYSGFFLGLSYTFYDPMIFISLFFMLIYFWEKTLGNFVKYLIAFGIGVLPRLILDYIIFNNPFYSIIRFWGNNVLVLLGVYKNSGILGIFSDPSILVILLAISPLLFKIYKVKLKENKKELLFLGLTFLFLFIRTPALKYFFLISPLIILVLSECFNKRDIKWHCILSIPVILLLTYGFFGANEDFKIQQDVHSILNDYKVDYIIGPPLAANSLATFFWQNNPRIVWLEDYLASVKNETEFRSYKINLSSYKMRLNSNLEFSVAFRRFEDKQYNNYILILKKSDPVTEEFKLDKCYQILCVYKK